ncbi:MAG TPA: hypothetical protein DDY76_09400 [Opitutae bacterium]|nr:hypothetical protein [Opitutae bacterium]|tara:strand:- start:1997 stop:2200 length:204 start_codon:yes stop_codon:yes gene_type:complete
MKGGKIEIRIPSKFPIAKSDKRNQNFKQPTNQTLEKRTVSKQLQEPWQLILLCKITIIRFDEIGIPQ